MRASVYRTGLEIVLQIVLAECLPKSMNDLLEYYLFYTQCAKHTQHATARGSGGMSPRKILKIISPEMASGSKFSQKIVK